MIFYAFVCVFMHFLGLKIIEKSDLICPGYAYYILLKCIRLSYYL